MTDQNIALDVAEESVDHIEDSQVDQQEKPAGHLSQEEWEASGRDPKDWKPKEVWKERGQLLKEQARLKRQYEEEIENVKRYYKASTLVMAQRIEELESRRDEAIELGDKDGVKKIDRQIRELENAAPQPVQQKNIPNVEITQWEDANPWIYDDSDPRTEIAKITFAKAASEGLTAKQALREIEDVLKQKFPTATRTQKQIAEQPSSKTTSSSTKTATMTNLSREEQAVWESGIYGTDEKSFLKAVSKIRGDK